MACLVVGDANADVNASVARFPHEGDDAELGDLAWTSGGSSANVATALARLGRDARLLARVGTDPAADVALAVARAAGVGLEGVQRDPTLATGLCFTAVSPGGERTFFSYRGANVALALPPAALDGIAWLHVGAHALLEGEQCATTLRLIDLAVERDVPVSLDLCLPLLRSAPDVVAAIVPRLAVLFANELERPLVPRGRGPSITVDKLGAGGARVHGPGFDGLLVPGFVVDAKDTTACGDAFVAGFLFALGAGAPLDVAGALGNALGALTATRPGAAVSLPGRQELHRFLSERGAVRELAVLEATS